MSHSHNEGWNNIGSFLRKVDTSINESDSELERKRETPRSKYHVDTVGDEVATLDDAIKMIDEIRLYAKRGILISRGQE